MLVVVTLVFGPVTNSSQYFNFNAKFVTGRAMRYILQSFIVSNARSW